MRYQLKGLLPGLILAMTTQSTPAAPPENAMSREVLLSKPVELASPNIQATVTRVVFPKGFKTPEHTHKGPGPRYVVKGRIKIEDHGQVQEYGPGQIFWETGSMMTAENVAESDSEIIIFEMAPSEVTTPAPSAE